MTGLLYPIVPRGRLPMMLRFALLGAVIAAMYGAVHDQISYAISPEYFTRMKFQQFRWADVGWPPRVFASVVGVLATWWAGLFAGWFLARAGLDLVPQPGRRRIAVRGFAIIIVTTIIFGALGVCGGIIDSRGNLDGWQRWRIALGLQDLRAFVIVAWLHGAGYAGALAGLVIAVAYVRRKRTDGAAG